ncbi:ketopantoate reductase family protein, partial [Oleiphilus sp. HI0123]
LNKAAESNDAARALLNYLQPPALDKTLTLQYEKDIWQALWHKLVINCAINPYTALLNCPNGQVRTSRRFIEGWPILKLELSELLNTASYPLSGDEIETLVFDVMQKTSTNISSMLQDIRAGKRTEIDDINGFAARFLAQHTLSSEVNSY